MNKRDDSYQVLVTNIKFNSEKTEEGRTYPDTLTFDVPDAICLIKSADKFKDAVETFVYNTLSRKFNSECCFCQIWLPND